MKRLTESTIRAAIERAPLLLIPWEGHGSPREIPWDDAGTEPGIVTIGWYREWLIALLCILPLLRWPY